MNLEELKVKEQKYYEYRYEYDDWADKLERLEKDKETFPFKVSMRTLGEIDFNANISKLIPENEQELKNDIGKSVREPLKTYIQAHMSLYKDKVNEIEKDFDDFNEKYPELAFDFDKDYKLYKAKKVEEENRFSIFKGMSDIKFNS